MEVVNTPNCVHFREEGKVNTQELYLGRQGNMERGMCVGGYRQFVATVYACLVSLTYIHPHHTHTHTPAQ